MSYYPKRPSPSSSANGWRGFQTGLPQRRRPRKRRRIGRWLCLAVLLIVAAVYGPRLFEANRKASAPERPAVAETINFTSKEDLRAFLDKQAFDHLTEKRIELQLNHQTLQIETSLDENLQNYLLSKLDRKNARDIGIVVMEADTGRVLAMAGFDRTGQAGNPCLRSNFPAASIFKIVTAASAVDHCNYTADSTVRFNGYKHTLYKRQLTDRVNKYTNTVSFKQAFAQSINPVFGKIGERRLGKPVLEKFAETFRFNEPLNFDLPLPPSHCEIEDDPYGWAEIASGFNRDTTLSPLHGAVMVSAILNDGRMVAPSIVDRIFDAQGNLLYQGQQSWEDQAMSPKAARELGRMMETTVGSGTARKYFRDAKRDKILSHLRIGGKTGSMGNKTHDIRYDWFVGFAEDRRGPTRLAVAVMVAHEKYIGIRASRYARMAISHYFETLDDAAKNKEKGSR